MSSVATALPSVARPLERSSAATSAGTPDAEMSAGAFAGVLASVTQDAARPTTTGGVEDAESGAESDPDPNAGSEPGTGPDVAARVPALAIQVLVPQVAGLPVAGPASAAALSVTAGSEATQSDVAGPEGVAESSGKSLAVSPGIVAAVPAGVEAVGTDAATVVPSNVDIVHVAASQGRHSSARPAADLAEPASDRGAISLFNAPAEAIDAAAPSRESAAASLPSVVNATSPAPTGGQSPAQSGSPATLLAGVTAAGVVPPQAEASAAAPAAQTPVPALVSRTAVGEPPAHQGLGGQLASPLFSLAAGSTNHTMTLRVSPESLGTITLQAHIGPGGVRIELFAGESARAALSNILPELRLGLSASGLSATLLVSDHEVPLIVPPAGGPPPQQAAPAQGLNNGGGGPGPGAQNFGQPGFGQPGFGQQGFGQQNFGQQGQPPPRVVPLMSDADPTVPSSGPATPVADVAATGRSHQPLDILV